MFPMVNAVVEGEAPDEICNREGCKGTIVESVNPLDGCSCHIDPPCSYCTYQGIECDECGWSDDRPV